MPELPSSRFPRDAGRLTTLLAVILIPLVGFLGLAFDGYRSYAFKDRLQLALSIAADDSYRAFKMAASEPTESARQALEQSFGQHFRQDDDPQTPPVVPRVQSAEDGVLRVGVEASTPAYFMQILGVPELRFALQETRPQEKTP